MKRRSNKVIIIDSAIDPTINIVAPLLTLSVLISVNLIKWGYEFFTWALGKFRLVKFWRRPWIATEHYWPMQRE